MALIYVVSLLYSVPRFFEFRVDHSIDVYKFRTTDLFYHEGYTIVYKTTLFFVVMYFTPMLAMCVLNMRLIRALRKSFAFSLAQARATSRVGNGGGGGMTSSAADAKASSTVAQQRSVSTIVVAIVVLFVICHIPAMTAHLFYSLHSLDSDEYAHLSCYRRYLSNVSNVLVNVNSASNFVIYCLCSQLFRSQFLRMLCPSCKRFRRTRRDASTEHSHRTTATLVTTAL